MQIDNNMKKKRLGGSVWAYRSENIRKHISLRFSAVNKDCLRQAEIKHPGAHCYMTGSCPNHAIWIKHCKNCLNILTFSTIWINVDQFLHQNYPKQFQLSWICRCYKLCPAKWPFKTSFVDLATSHLPSAWWSLACLRPLEEAVDSPWPLGFHRRSHPEENWLHRNRYIYNIYIYILYYIYLCEYLMLI